ncbi:MAG: hypothetical protein JWO67_1857 [Streptosporangiaceae bacterium]|nr:hypothetical protein [Streptosporangiaceae bacterium]
MFTPAVIHRHRSPRQRPRVGRPIGLAAVLVAGSLIYPVAAATSAAAASPSEVDFGVANDFQNWTVPDGVHEVTLNVIGGAGGDAYNAASCGGRGSSGAAGWVNARIPVAPGQVLSMWVGGGGHVSGGGGAGAPGGLFAGGGGGGAGSGASQGGGGGGGGSVVWSGTDHTTASTLIVAGGGGGGGGHGGIDPQCGGKGGDGGKPATAGTAAVVSLGTGGYGGATDTLDQLGTHSGLNGLTAGTVGGNQNIGGGGGGGGAGMNNCADDGFGYTLCYGLGQGGGNGGDDGSGSGGGGGGGGYSFADAAVASPFFSSSGAHGQDGQISITYGAATSTAVTPGSAHVGDAVTIHALVEPTDGRGTVTFASDGTAIPGCAAVPFTSGGDLTWQANCTTSSMPAGVHEVTAEYSGDTDYAGSADSNFWTIVQSTSTTVTTSPPSPVTVGSTLAITAAVQPSDGRGTVEFTDDQTAIAGCTALTPTDDGTGNYQATCTTSAPAAGTHTLTANYSGDSISDPSTGTTTLTVSPQVAAPGAPTNVTATPGDGSATATFAPPSSDGGAPISHYTVTSAPGGKTATGIGSPITVTGLTNGTAYTFTVTATNSAGTGPASAASNPVTPAARLTIDTSSLPVGTVGTAYSATLTATGGIEPFTWSLATGSSLPAGLTLHQDGTITGTPSAAGSRSVTVKVVDGATPANTATQALTLTVNPPPRADLAVSNTHDGSFSTGGYGWYRLTVTNTGNAATAGTTTISESLPHGLSYVMALGWGWSCRHTGSTGTCTHAGALAASATSSVTVLVHITAPRGTILTTTATVTPTDTTPADNSSTDRVTVQRR